MRIALAVVLLMLLALSAGGQSATQGGKPVVDAELVYVGSGGFIGPALERTAGKVILELSDISGLPDLKPQVVDDKGNVVSQMCLDPSDPCYKPKDLLNLHAGQYHLKEPAHPDWDLLIEVGK